MESHINLPMLDPATGAPSQMAAMAAFDCAKCPWEDLPTVTALNVPPLVSLFLALRLFHYSWHAARDWLTN